MAYRTIETVKMEINLERSDSTKLSLFKQLCENDKFRNSVDLYQFFCGVSLPFAFETIHTTRPVSSLSERICQLWDVNTIEMNMFLMNYNYFSNFREELFNSPIGSNNVHFTLSVEEKNN